MIVYIKKFDADMHIVVVDNAGADSCFECCLRDICKGCNLEISQHFEYENR